jgi:microcystin-dependent protein
MKYNKNLAGTQITDELINRSTSASIRLAADTILASTVVVRTAPAGGGTLLALTTDYTLGGADSRLTTEAGGTVNTTLAIVNGARLNTNLYVTYKTVGDYAEAEDVNNLKTAIATNTPSGTVVMFAGSAAPTDWLLCDGAAVSRTTYAALFSAIGTTWGAGNGSTTFNLPDMRGAAPAGVGTSAGYTQNETLALGTKYNDQFQGHGHDEMRLDGVDFSYATNGTAGPANIMLSSAGGARNRYTMLGTINNGVDGNFRKGNVTRGKLVGVNFIIKV